MDINSTIKLNNGVEIPVLGLGVFLSAPGEETFNAVTWALEAGYRHIDTAAYYGNEADVGRAIKASGIPREQIFVTTKLWNDDCRKNRQKQGFAESLRRLGLDYIDLYLIHWPVAGKYVESWQALEEIYESGEAKSIGVSNFHIHHLEVLFKQARVIPAINQVECSPQLTQNELAAYCRQKEIIFEPWSPLGRGTLLNEPVLTAIAGKYNKTTAQVILRWCIQRGFVNIPKSVNRERIIANAQIFDFQLLPDDMEKISAMNKNRRVGPDPDNFSF